MECNKEEALRAKEIAEKKFEIQDFTGARKLIHKAQQLYPALENVPQMLAVCDVHCVARAKLNGCETDWYGVLQVEPTADDSIIKKQYRKLALLLHPDKNKFCGAEAAFKLVGEAMAILSDSMKRTLYDVRRRAASGNNVTSKTSRFQTGAMHSSNGHSGMQQHNMQTQSGIHVRVQTQSGVHVRVQTQPGMQAQPNADPTFWTICPFCSVKYQYLRTVENKYLLCQTCQRPFIAKDLNFTAGSGVHAGYAWNASSIPQQQDFSKQGANFSGPGSVQFNGSTRAGNNSNQTFASSTASQGAMNGSGRTASVPKNAAEEKAKEEAYKQQMHEKAKMASEAEAARKKMKEEEKEQKRKEKEAEKKAKAEAKAEALKKIEIQRKAKADKAAGNEKTRKRIRKLKDSSSSDSDVNADITLEDNLSDEQTAPSLERGVPSRRKSNRSKRNVTYRVDGSDDEDFVDFPLSKRSRETKDGTDESVTPPVTCSSGLDSEKDKLQTESDKGEKQNIGQKEKKNTGQKKKQNPKGKLSDDSEGLKDEKDNQKRDAGFTKEENTEETNKEAVKFDCAKEINHDKNGNKAVGNEDNEIKSPESPSKCSNASSSPEPETFTVPDADFHDFDKDRTEKDFSDGQIWAAYDNIDGMPRFYARINKVLSTEPFKCRITWLESCPITEEQVDWEEKNLPVSCGMYKRAKADLIEGVNTFSHIAKWEKCRQRGSVNIFPQKDDVWAVYKNWNIGWKDSENGSPKFEYEMVEVLTDFSEETGVEVAFLAKVIGFKVIFKRREEQGVKHRMHIPLNELLRFSHQVPAYKMTGDESDGVPKGCWELDPASMPPELFRTDSIKSSAR